MHAFAISVVLMSGACGDASTAAACEAQKPRPAIVYREASPAATSSVSPVRHFFLDGNSPRKRQPR